MKQKQGNNAINVLFEFCNKYVHVRWEPPNAKMEGWQNSLANSTVQSCIKAAGKADEALVAALKDETMSAIGRMQHVKPQLDAALGEIKASRQKLAQEKARIAEARGNLYASPTLAESDVASALMDYEIRQGFPKLVEGQRQALQSQMQRGGDPEADRVLFALARDPFTTPDSQFARGVVKARVEKKNSGALERLDVEDEAIVWALSVLVQLEAILGSADNHGLGGGQYGRVGTPTRVTAN